jgi:hypothetical protein
LKTAKSYLSFDLKKTAAAKGGWKLKSKAWLFVILLIFWIASIQAELRAGG